MRLPTVSLWIYSYPSLPIISFLCPSLFFLSVWFSLSSLTFHKAGENTTLYLPCSISNTKSCEINQEGRKKSAMSMFLSCNPSSPTFLLINSVTQFFPHLPSSSYFPVPPRGEVFLEGAGIGKRAKSMEQTRCGRGVRVEDIQAQE